jgi:hypothetical protein
MQLPAYSNVFQLIPTYFIFRIHLMSRERVRFRQTLRAGRCRVAGGVGPQSQPRKLLQPRIASNPPSPGALIPTTERKALAEFGEPNWCRAWEANHEMGSDFSLGGRKKPCLCVSVVQIPGLANQRLVHSVVGSVGTDFDQTNPSCKVQGMLKRGMKRNQDTSELIDRSSQRPDRSEKWGQKNKTCIS